MKILIVKFSLEIYLIYLLYFFIRYRKTSTDLIERNSKKSKIRVVKHL